jgi:hypothetical protein
MILKNLRQVLQNLNPTIIQKNREPPNTSNGLYIIIYLSI